MSSLRNSKSVSVYLKSPSHINMPRPLAVSTPINEKKRKNRTKTVEDFKMSYQLVNGEHKSEEFQRTPPVAEFWTCAEDMGSDHSSCDDIFSHLNQY